MPTTKRRRRRSRKELTIEQILDFMAFEHWISGGPRSKGSPFESEDERRLAWEAHREELMATSSRSPGVRPAAFFAYDLPEGAERQPGETDVDLLHRLGLLEPWEEEELRLQRAPADPIDREDRRG